MVFLLLSVFFLFGLALERLTLAASFFFIWLHPRGECRNSVKPRLWKTLKLLSQSIQAARGKQPFYTAETLDASTAPEEVQSIISRARDFAGQSAETHGA